MRPKAQLSKAKPPASETAEICRSCFLAQLIAGSKALVSNGRIAGLMVPVWRDNKAQIAAKAGFGAMMRSKIVARSFKMRLVQFWARDGHRAVASLSDDGHARVIQGVVTSYELASRAIAEKLSLKA